MHVQQMVLHWIAVYGSFALFGLLMLGIIGLPIPDETLLTFAGVLVSRGKLALLPTWLAGVCGGISGISCSYLIGKTTGLVVVRRYGHWLHLTTSQLDRAGQWLSRGKWMLTLGYFVPGIRHLTGIVAGSAGLSYKMFATFSYLGAVLWASAFVFLGWSVGEKWESILDETHRFLSIGVIVVLLGALTYLAIHKRHSSS